MPFAVIPKVASTTHLDSVEEVESKKNTHLLKYVMLYLLWITLKMFRYHEIVVPRVTV